MTIHRYEVTDAEWAIIEPMLPKHHMGRPQKDLRAHFNGILWIARSGARWAELEELNIDSTTSKVSEQASRGPRKR